jgi:hypothetical protein
MKDKAGRELQTGDFFVTAIRRGVYSALRYGRVLDGAVDALGRIRIQTVIEDYGYGRNPRLDKPGYWVYGDRSLLISKLDIPENIRRVFEDEN